MIKIPSVFNIRPEAIKIVPPFSESQNPPEEISSYICFAAQRQAILLQGRSQR